MKPVTDPELIRQLDDGGAGPKPVTDPAVLAQLNGAEPAAPVPPATPAKKPGFAEEMVRAGTQGMVTGGPFGAALGMGGVGLKKASEGLDWVGNAAGDWTLDKAMSAGASPKVAAGLATAANAVASNAPMAAIGPEGLAMGARGIEAMGSGLRGAAGSLAGKARTFYEDFTGKGARKMEDTLKERLLGELGAGKSATEKALDAETKFGDIAKTEQAKSADAARRAAVPGTPIKKELGQIGPVPKTTATLGDEMRAEATTFLSEAEKVRQVEKDKLLKASEGEVKMLEGQGHHVADQAWLKKTVAMLDKEIQASPPAMRAKLRDLKDNITKGAEVAVSKDEQAAAAKARAADKMIGKGSGDIPQTRQTRLGFEGLDRGRRYVGKMAYDKEAKGYDAETAVIADRVYRQLSEGMGQYSKSFGEYLKSYSDLSKPLDIKGSRIGRAVTRGQGGLSDEMFHSTDAAELPDRVFRSPESYREFVQAIGGNKAKAEGYAKQWLAAKLTDMSGAEARKFLTKNRALLDELPGVRDMVQKTYFEPLIYHEGRAEKAGEMAKVSGKESERLAGKAKAYSDQFDHLETMADPKALLTKANQIVDGLQSDGMIDKARAIEIKKQIDAARDRQANITEARALAVTVGKQILYGSAGLGAIYGIKKGADYVLP